jgi:hypothetical protein
MGQMKAVLFKIKLTFDRIKFNGLHLMLLRYMGLSTPAAHADRLLQKPNDYVAKASQRV